MKDEGPEAFFQPSSFWTRMNYGGGGGIRHPRDHVCPEFPLHNS